MKWWTVLLCLAVLVGSMARGAAQAPVAQAHVAAAKAVISPKGANARPWQNFDAMFRLICTQPRPGAREPAVGPGESDELAKTKPVPRDQWYVPPAKVFDNLYFIGTKTESTWALTTSEGIILLLTNFDWVMPDLLGELKTFGLNPADIKYVVVLRSHSDQAWGINPVKKIVPPPASSWRPGRGTCSPKTTRLRISSRPGTSLPATATR